MRWLLAGVCALAITSAGCAGGIRPEPFPSGPEPPDASSSGEAAKRPLRTAVGLASFYGKAFQGRTTASGIPFDRHDPVAAHPAYPFGTLLRVTNLSNLRQVIVTVVDRGPARRYQREGVIIDLAQSAARTLGFIRKGRQRVRVDVLSWGGNAAHAERDRDAGAAPDRDGGAD